jgi:hypothetical protein
MSPASIYVVNRARASSIGDCEANNALGEKDKLKPLGS